MRTIDCAPESNCVSVCFSRFLLNNAEDGHLGHKEARTPSFWNGQLIGQVHGHFTNATNFWLANLLLDFTVTTTLVNLSVER